MLIVYDSKTGNVERFVRKLALRSLKIEEDTIIQEPYILITYTTKFGEVPKSVSHFLERNYSYLAGVSASGNRNWGQFFAKSADVISNTYKVPVINKFEMFGNQQDVIDFLEGVYRLETYTA